MTGDELAAEILRELVEEEEGKWMGDPCPDGQHVFKGARNVDSIDTKWGRCERCERALVREDGAYVVHHGQDCRCRECRVLPVFGPPLRDRSEFVPD